MIIQRFKSLSITLFLAAMLPVSAAAADFNPIKGSYGSWHGIEDNFWEINSKGVKFAVEAPKRCRQKKHGFIHERSKISGKKLLKDIQDSVEYSENKDISQLEALINPNQHYMRIDAALSCNDGLFSFIYINEKVSIGMFSAPDDIYFILVKR